MRAATRRRGQISASEDQWPAPREFKQLEGRARGGLRRDEAAGVETGSRNQAVRGLERKIQQSPAGAAITPSRLSDRSTRSPRAEGRPAHVHDAGPTSPPQDPRRRMLARIAEHHDESCVDRGESSTKADEANEFANLLDDVRINWKPWGAEGCRGSVGAKVEQLEYTCRNAEHLAHSPAQRGWRADRGNPSTAFEDVARRRAGTA